MKHLILLIALSTLTLTAAEKNSPNISTEKIFNGKDLNNWSGYRDVWTVDDGTILADTSKQEDMQTNWLIWNDDLPDSYEVSYQYKFLTEVVNAGVQYNAVIGNPKTFKVKGFQADLADSGRLPGALYVHGGLGVLGLRGSQIEIKDSQSNITKEFNVPEDFQAGTKKGEWATYRIIYYKNRALHIINDWLMMDIHVIDMDPELVGRKLAFQIHRAPKSPMKIQFKDIELRDLTELSEQEEQAYFKELSLQLKNISSLTPLKE